MLYILPWIILLIGLLLIFAFTPTAFKKTTNAGGEIINLAQSEIETEEEVIEYLHSLETEMSSLKTDLQRLGKELDKEKKESFSEILEEKQQTNPELELYKTIYQAFDQGNSVTEIAKETGRGKGEIELILGLRR